MVGGHGVDDALLAFPGLVTNSILLFPFREKSLICLDGKLMNPSLGNTFLFRSYQQLPPSPTLKGLFELTQRPSMALDLPRALLPELQKNKVIIRCAVLGEEPGHNQKQLT